MRRTTILLALTVAVLDLATFAAGEVRVAREAGSFLELGLGAFASRANVTLVFVLPWVIGAILMQRERRGLGAAVLVPAALLTAPSLMLVGRTIGDAVDGAGVTLWLESSASVATWLVAVAAGVAAWLTRPRSDLRDGSPGRGNAYVILAFLAWLPTLLASTQLVVPGTEGTPQGARHYYEFIWDALGSLSAAVGVAEAVIFGVLLVVGPSLRRDLAGALVVVVALPALVAEVQTIVTVWAEPFVVSTPASVLGTVGMVGVVVIGISWIVRGAPRATPTGSGDPATTQ